MRIFKERKVRRIATPGVPQKAYRLRVVKHAGARYVLLSTPSWVWTWVLI